MEQQTYPLSRQEPTQVLALSQGDKVTWFSGTPLNITYNITEDFLQLSVLENEGCFVAPVDAEYTLKIDVDLLCSDSDMGVVVIQCASDFHVTLDDIVVNVGDVIVDVGDICVPIVFPDICAEVDGKKVFITPVRKGENLTYYYPTGELIESEITICESLCDCDCSTCD